MSDFDKVFVVLVLYNCDLKDSQTYKSILQNNDRLKFKGIVYDNSYLSRDMSGLEELGDFTYIHDSSNPGLAYAYNYALKEAIKVNCEWLLLLDQDTYFTDGYFKSLSEVGFDERDITAFLPIVKSFSNKNELISPAKIDKAGFKPISNYNIGKQVEKVSGINSGTIISIDFVQSINGFNTNYPLDMLDHWYFREIYKSRKFVSILNSEIYQNLSVSNDFENNMSLVRYLNFLKVENEFFKTDKLYQFLFYKLRLLFRVLKQIKFKNKGYYKATLTKILSL